MEAYNRNGSIEQHIEKDCIGKTAQQKNSALER